MGSGNIGTDVLYKLRRSAVLEPVAMIGVDPASEGLARAQDLGLWTTHEGLAAFLDDPISHDVALVFDATSASAHRTHADLLARAGKLSVDMTPAACGPYLVPPVNFGEHRTAREVNMVTCGGQATTPIVAAISRVQPVAYAEIVASIASRSAGPGTRQNIDEFTETTARALETVGGARKGKAIIVLNPAEPPVMMRNTVHVQVEGDVLDEAGITAAVERMVAEIQAYVPGYRLTTPPLFEGNRVSVLIEVRGAGDYLPEYAGNLDIMTSAAVRVGEDLARAHAPQTPAAAAAA